MAREAVFSHLDALDALHAQAQVLDLFAGTGALGLEALSRGVKHATLVDSASQAVALCKKNASLCGFTEKTTVVGMPVATFLTKNLQDFDIVFIDPPYDFPPHTLTDILDQLLPRLSSEASVVVESAKRAGPPVFPSGFEVYRSKAYGDTLLTFAYPL